MAKSIPVDIFFIPINQTRQVLCVLKIQLYRLPLKKSRIRETKHLSTDVDSSNDTTKPHFFWKTELIMQNAKPQKCLKN